MIANNDNYRILLPNVCANEGTLRSSGAPTASSDATCTAATGPDRTIAETWATAAAWAMEAVPAWEWAAAVVAPSGTTSTDPVAG